MQEGVVSPGYVFRYWFILLTDININLCTPASIFESLKS